MINHSKPHIGSLEREYLLKALESPLLVNGAFTQAFEKAVLAYFNVSDFFYTNSGTEALFLILKALELKEGDEIILPSYVCESVWYAVVKAGLKPVLTDIGDNWVAAEKEISDKITPKTKAIVAVYTFGLPCDIENITKLGIPVIEDICQSVGLEINGKKAGTFGVASFTSFNAIKCLTTGGDGGGVFTDNREIAEKLKRMKSQYFYTGGITEIQAAVGLAQIEQYDAFLKRREEIAERYNKTFEGRESLIQTSYGKGMNYRFAVKMETDVENAIQKFAERNIHLRRGVDKTLHTAFGIKGDFPNTNNTFRTTLSFPIYPALSDEELESVSGAVDEIFSETFELKTNVD